jgi:hypothetical protein
MLGQFSSCELRLPIKKLLYVAEPGFHEAPSVPHSHSQSFRPGVFKARLCLSHLSFEESNLFEQTLERIALGNGISAIANLSIKVSDLIFKYSSFARVILDVSKKLLFKALEGVAHDSGIEDCSL